MSIKESLINSINHEKLSKKAEWLTELEVAGDTIIEELQITNLDKPDAVALKAEEALSNPSFLERIRSNDLLRKSFKVMIVAFALMRAEPLAAKPVEKEKIENTISKNKIQNNKALIIEGEYVVPRNVLVSFMEVVDPDAHGVPAGCYLNKNYIKNEERREIFYSKLEKMGYSKEEIQKYLVIFEGKDIVFSEDDLKEGGQKEDSFKSILVHERLHKEIDHLSEDLKNKLNEARDFILKDYHDKEMIWSNSNDKLFIQFKTGKISHEDYKKMAIDEVHKTNPILLDKDGDTQGIDPLLVSPNEFWTYFSMNKLNPSVKDYLINKFPESYRIYLNLKEKIDLQIMEKEAKI